MTAPPGTGRALILSGDGTAAGPLVDALRRRAVGAALGAGRSQPGSRRADLAAIFDEAEAALGGDVDGLVCIGPALGGASLPELDYGTWRAEVGAAVDAAFFATQELAARLAADGRPGAIVHVCPSLPDADPIQRSTITAAVVGLTKASAAELAPRVRVNAVLPSPEGIDHAAVSAMVWLLCDATYCTGTVVDLAVPTTAYGLRW